VPYDWDQQVTLLRRELERARASLASRNSGIGSPPLEPANTPEPGARWARCVAQAH